MLKLTNLNKMGINTKWLKPLNEIIGTDVVYDKVAVAIFLSQCSHESANFTKLEESFNYKPDRLLSVFKNRIKDIGHARLLCASGQQAIANFVYNGRMGNSLHGDDGYNYRGRGIIQLTGKENYIRYGKALNIDLENNFELAKDETIACKIAGLYWKANHCNSIAQGNLSLDEKIKQITKKINGGYNGLKDRMHLFNKYMGALDE